MKVKTATFMIIVLAVLIVGVQTGFIIAESSGNTIFAAYSNKTGVLRYLANPGDYNPKSETPIHWNVQGLPGEAGAGFNNLSSAYNNINGATASEEWTETLLPFEEGDPNPSPSVTAEITSGKALVMITVNICQGDVGIMITGNTTRGPDENPVLTASGHEGNFPATTSGQYIITDLTNGPNTFTLMFKNNYGTFDQKQIIVIPLP